MGKRVSCGDISVSHRRCIYFYRVAGNKLSEKVKSTRRFYVDALQRQTRFFYYSSVRQKEREREREYTKILCSIKINEI